MCENCGKESPPITSKKQNIRSKQKIIMHFQSLIQRRITWISVSFFIGLCLLVFAAWPYTTVLPSEPFEAGAGPCPPCQIDRLEIVVSIPTNSISMTVFFNSCSSSKYHAWALLPFLARNVTASVYAPSIGTLPIKASFENLLEHRACIANATFSPSKHERFSEVRLYLTFDLESNLEATRYLPEWNPLASTRAVILTFFGPRGTIGYTKKLQAYEGVGLNTTLLITTPLYVHFNIPSEMHLSPETFPQPVQYYIRDEDVWVMFHPIFPMDNYAQTIACYFIDPTRQQWKQISIFIAGAFIGLCMSFMANIIEEKTKKKSRSKSNSMSYDYPEEEIRKHVKIALGVLRKNDSFLLESDANERSIAHKLAEYLQKQFPDWHVDCEYNRKGLETKKLEGIKECEEGRRRNIVYPDIIVHERNTRHNLLVIELKKKDQNYQCDLRKLELFTDTKDEFGYTLGLFIRFDDSRIELKWFKNGKETDSESY